jgi:hypothetical protein
MRAAGTTVGDATTALREADCGTPYADLSGALPGGVSAGAASDFAQTWSCTFKGWRDQAGQHASNLTQAAANYNATEDSNTHRLDPDGGKIRGPR